MTGPPYFLRVLAGTLLLCLQLVAAAAQTNAATDGEAWNEVDLSARFNSHATVTVPIVLRDSFRLSNPQLFGVGPLVDLSLSKRLTLTLGYLFVDLPNTGAGFAVHVPLAAITLRQTIGCVRLSDRNRAEGLFGLPRSPIRYRNKLVISAPFAHERWLPFLSNEVFYDYSKSYWSQNRLQAGLGRQVSSRTRVDFFYMERSAHKSNPAASHVVGATMEIKLRSDTFRRGLPHEEN